MFCMLRECSEKASWSRASKREGGRGSGSYIGLVETIRAVTESELGGLSPSGNLYDLSKFQELKRTEDRMQVSPVRKPVLSLRRKENQRQALC